MVETVLIRTGTKKVDTGPVFIRVKKKKKKVDTGPICTGTKSVTQVRYT